MTEIRLLSWPGVRTCGNETLLNVNQACFDIVSSLSTEIQLLTRNTECYECPFTIKHNIKPNATTSVVVDTLHPLELRLPELPDKNCSEILWFEDFGLYRWNISNKGCTEISVVQEPERFWFNVGIVSAIILICFILYRATGCLLTNQRFIAIVYGNAPFQELENDLGNPGTPTRNLARTRRQARVATLDVFRGFAISLMIFVNYGGGQYSVFKHAPWNGLTVADVVFPFFLWAMGASAVISLRSQLRASTCRKKIFVKIFRRSVILICIGLILNSGKGGSDKSLRISGVLQRIGVTYFVIATIELIFGRPQRSERYGPWSIFAEFTDSIVQWVLVLLLVVVHVSLTFFLPVPDCPTGYLGPGGLASNSSFENCTGGATGYIDRLIFTNDHIYQHPTCQKVYNTHIPFDPEGLLGVLTSILTAFFGVHCGRIILTYQLTSSRLKRWIAAALSLGIVAGLLCSWSKEGGLIPINKNLWSLSYVLATTSLAFLIFSIVYCLVDDLRLWAGGPFVYVGMNSIILYVGHSVLTKQLPWRWNPLSSTHLELLVMDTSATAFWLLVAFLLYRNNIFVSI